MKEILKFCTICLLLLLPTDSFSLGSDAVKKPTSSPTGSEVTKDSQAGSELSGKIVETMNSGGYTYINLERDGKKIWVAVPKMDVKVGQEISLFPGTKMGTFTSKSLKRTFDDIIFSSGPIHQQANEEEAVQKETMDDQSTKVSPIGVIKVEKASGSDAYTIGELYTNKDLLDKKSVVVRGKVVKVSSGIMGKNWIHLQDGSGSPKEKSDDLVVTSQDLPDAGETVTARGTIYKNRDFGSGYRYSVIMEDASISK